MAEINNYYANIPLGRPVDQPTQQPQDRSPQQQPFLTETQAAGDALQRSSGKAPLNVLPNNETLQRLISTAQEQQSAGKDVGCGCVVNLVV